MGIRTPFDHCALYSVYEVSTGEKRHLKKEAPRVCVIVTPLGFRFA